MNKKYPYWLYEDAFNRTKDAAEKSWDILDEESYESTRINKREWRGLTATEQDYAIIMLEEEHLEIKKNNEPN